MSALCNYNQVIIHLDSTIILAFLCRSTVLFKSVVAIRRQLDYNHTLCLLKPTCHDFPCLIYLFIIGCLEQALKRGNKLHPWLVAAVDEVTFGLSLSVVLKCSSGCCHAE